MGNEICCLWNTLDKNTGKPRSLFIVYEYEGKYYGRIIAIYNKEGVIKETMYHPTERAPGVADHPFYCGLDILWNLTQEGNRYKGKIMDPEEGKIYNAEVWRSGHDLIVRGKLLFFGRNETWKETSFSQLPKEFKQSDLEKLKPKIPVPD
jgi:uncharacterized protein (DUF2147 family)